MINQTAQLIRENMFDYYDCLSASKAVTSLRSDTSLSLATRLPVPFLNPAVLRTPDIGTADLRRCREFFGNARVNQFSLWGTNLRDLRATGEAFRPDAGIVYQEGANGMALDVERFSSVPTHARRNTVQTVNSESLLKKWVEAATIGFGMPEESRGATYELFLSLMTNDRLINYVATDADGQPVATAQLFVSAAGVCGLYWISVVPDKRGAGIGRDITQHAVNEALSSGNGTVVLHATPSGYSLYQRLGFVEHTRMNHWVVDGV